MSLLLALADDSFTIVPGETMMNVLHTLGDYIEIDINDHGKPDLIFDLTRGLPFPDSSVDDLWAYGFPEGIPAEWSTYLLGEIFRVLKPTNHGHQLAFPQLPAEIEQKESLPCHCLYNAVNGHRVLFLLWPDGWHQEEGTRGLIHFHADLLMREIQLSHKKKSQVFQNFD